MATYRTSRNIEASIVDYITAALTAGGWSNISVVKSYNLVYDSQNNTGGASSKGIICVHVGEAHIERYEIGTNAILPQRTIIIEIFAADDGQRLDLKDFLISSFITGIPYYTYVTTVSGRTSTVTTKTLSGRLNILSMDEGAVNFNVNKDSLNKMDRFRHRITLIIQRNQPE